MGARPRHAAVLHQRDVRLHRELPELHEARQAEPGVPALAVAARRLHRRVGTTLRRRAVPTAPPRKVDPLRRRLPVQQPRPVARVHPVAVGGLPGAVELRGFRALAVPGVRVNGGLLLDAVPGAVAPDAWPAGGRRAGQAGRGVRRPQRPPPRRARPAVGVGGQGPRRRGRVRVALVRAPRRVLPPRPGRRVPQLRRGGGGERHHAHQAGGSAAGRVPDRAPGAGRDGRVQRDGDPADGGADALRERRVVRRRGVHGDGAGGPRRPGGDGGAGGRVLQGAGGGVCGGGGGREEERRAAEAHGRDQDDAPTAGRAPRPVRTRRRRARGLRHRLPALVPAGTDRCVERPSVSDHRQSLDVFHCFL